MYQVLQHDAKTLKVSTSRDEASASDPDLIEVYDITDVLELRFQKCSCCEDRFVVVLGAGDTQVEPTISDLKPIWTLVPPG